METRKVESWFSNRGLDLKTVGCLGVGVSAEMQRAMCGGGGVRQLP